MSSAGKKKGGKEKGKNAAAAQPEVLEQINKALEAEMLALEIQLQETDEKLTKTLKEENLHKEKCEQYKKDLKAEERRHLDVCCDLSRQYKALQRDYMNQLDDTQSAFQAHRREYAEQSILLRQLGASRDKELAEYDTRVRAMKIKMDRISDEFVVLLNEIQEMMVQQVQSPLIHSKDETERFTEVLEASKSEYFKKLSEIIRDREEKYPLGSGWRGAGTKAPDGIQPLGV